MDACNFEKRVARWFDGEVDEAKAIESHIAECLSCKTYLDFLKLTRRGVDSAEHSTGISDVQLPAFLDGLREHVESRPARRHTGLWAMASVACAAIISAASIWYTVTPATGPVEAQTVVESHATGIEGATTEVEYADDGTATVWINVPDGEMM